MKLQKIFLLFTSIFLPAESKQASYEQIFFSVLFTSSSLMCRTTPDILIFLKKYLLNKAMMNGLFIIINHH